MINDLIERIRLVRSPGIGPVTFRQLIARFGTAAVALAAIPDLARRGGGKVPRLMSSAEAEQEAARVEKLGARYLASLGQGLYPSLLAEMDDAPPLLIATGDLSCSTGARWRSSAPATLRLLRAVSRGRSLMISGK